MATRAKGNQKSAALKSSTRKRPPAKTLEGRESQIVAKAMDLAEQQIEDGSVSAQVLSHFVSIGSTKARLEKEIREKEALLIQAKADALTSQKKTEELYTSAIEAMRRYAGFSNESS